MDREVNRSLAEFFGVLVQGAGRLRKASLLGIGKVWREVLGDLSDAATRVLRALADEREGRRR